MARTSAPGPKGANDASPSPRRCGSPRRTPCVPRPAPAPRRRPCLLPEVLETRRLLSAASAASSAYESVDGTGNNLAHTDLGQRRHATCSASPRPPTATAFPRPAGANRPSARAISNAVDAQPRRHADNSRAMSDFVYAWGQFLDHDLDLTNDGTPAEAVQHRRPDRRPAVRPDRHRHAGHPPDPLALRPRHRHQHGQPAPADQLRHAAGSTARWSTAPTPTTAASLRTFTGGQLKTSAGNLLPTGLRRGQFLAGDVRANENPELTAIQTLFVREHNRIAGQLAAANPGLDRRADLPGGPAAGHRRDPVDHLQRVPPRPARPRRPRPLPGLQPERQPRHRQRVLHRRLPLRPLDRRRRHRVPRQQRQRHPPRHLSGRRLLQPLDPARENGIDPILKYLASDRAPEDDTEGGGQPAQPPVRPPGAGGTGPGGAEHPARPRPRPGRLQHHPRRLRPAAGHQLRPDHLQRHACSRS